MKLPIPIVHSIVLKSPPSRGAWIEMLISSTAMRICAVAPLAGGVD